MYSTGPVSVSMKATFPPCFLSSSIMVSLGWGEAQPVDGWMEEHHSFSNSPIRARQSTTETHTSTRFALSLFSFPLCSFVSHISSIMRHVCIFMLHKNITEVSVCKPTTFLNVCIHLHKWWEKQNIPFVHRTVEHFQFSTSQRFCRRASISVRLQAVLHCHMLTMTMTCWCLPSYISVLACWNVKSNSAKVQLGLMGILSSSP